MVYNSISYHGFPFRKYKNNVKSSMMQSFPRLSPRRIIVLGAGTFGKQAATRLSVRYPHARFVIVDRKESLPAAFSRALFPLIRRDGIDYLAETLDPADADTWIVPAIPVHVAYSWMKRTPPPDGRIVSRNVPEALRKTLPHPLRGPDGALFASIADFRCPENCPAPEAMCSHTGKPRPMVLHRYIAALNIPGFTVVVVESRQLAPGTGGYAAADLFSAKTKAFSAETPVILATASKCHGVLHAFRVLT
jgi:hypothetical protein